MYTPIKYEKLRVWIKGEALSPFSEIHNIIFVLGIICIAITAQYRYRTHSVIVQAYSEFSRLGFMEYMAGSIQYDGIVFIASIIFSLIISVVLRGRRISVVILSVFFIAQLFIYLNGAEFFRIYETSFQKQFAGAENFTDIPNIIRSSVFEYSRLFYVFLIFESFFIIMILKNVVRHAGIKQSSTANKKNRMWGYYRAVNFILILSIIFITIGTNLADGSKYWSVKNNDRNDHLLTEFAVNPFLELFSRSLPASKPDKSPQLSNDFRYGQNTDSNNEKKFYPRITEIPRGKKHDILIYVFESTAASYVKLEAKGKPVMSSWRKMMKNALVAVRHYANYPLSANALLTLLTGSYEMLSKDMAITRYPEINLMTISRILQKNGYRTCLVHTGGLEYCGQNRFLKNRGFDRIIEYKDLQHNKPYNRQVGWGIDERAMIKSIKDFVSDDRARPFFIIVMPVNPHHPYAIPDKSFECTGAIHEGISYKERNWRQYLHSLHYADHSMGMMIDELEKNGMLNNAITVCYADHGEAFYQHPGNYNHPLYLYEENVHVPFMIYSKKYFSETSFYNGISRHIDIAPTILDIIGLNKPQSFEGISILSAHHEQYAVLHTSWKNNYMGIRDGRWKYIQSMDFGSEELYDLSLDPNEKKNLSRELNEKTRYYRFLTEKSRNYRIKFYNHIINYSAKNPAKKHK